MIICLFILCYSCIPQQFFFAIYLSQIYRKEREVRNGMIWVFILHSFYRKSFLLLPYLEMHFSRSQMNKITIDNRSGISNRRRSTGDSNWVRFEEFIGWVPWGTGTWLELRQLRFISIHSPIHLPLWGRCPFPNRRDHHNSLCIWIRLLQLDHSHCLPLHNSE